MRINPIQNQSFRALKISKNAREFLNKLPDYELDTLKNAGEEFKDYKYADLYITSVGYQVGDRVLKTNFGSAEKDTDIDILESKAPENRFSVRFNSPLPPLKGYRFMHFDFDDVKTARENCEKLKQSKGAARMIELVRMLEKNYIEKSKYNTAKTNPKVKELMDKYCEY